MGEFSGQENSAGRPSSQSQLPRFESFRYIVPNVFVEEEPQKSENGVLPVNFESFNRQETEEKSREKKRKGAKKSMFNVKNNPQINNLRQKVIQRSFRSGFESTGAGDSVQNDSSTPRRRKKREQKQSINGRMGALYAENIRQSLEDIEKGIGEVVKKISVYSKKNAGRAGADKGRGKPLKNRVSIAKDPSKKKVRKKRKSVSRSTKKKPKEGGSSSHRHSKKNSNMFSDFSSDGKTFALFSSSLKNSLLQNERRQTTTEELSRGLASLKDSGIFRKKSKSKRAAKEVQVSMSATRDFDFERSPTRVKRDKSRERTSKPRKSKSIRSSVAKKRTGKSPRKSVGKSPRKSRKKSTSCNGKSKRLKTAKVKSFKVKSRPVVDLGTFPALSKPKSRSKRDTRKGPRATPSFLKNPKRARDERTGAKVGREPRSELEKLLVEDSETESRKSADSEEDILQARGFKRRSSNVDMKSLKQSKHFDVFQKRKSLLENRKTRKARAGHSRNKISHKKTQSQVDLRKKKNPKSPMTPKIKSIRVPRNADPSKTLESNRQTEQAKPAKNSLHSLLYRKLKSSKLPNLSRKAGIHSERGGVSRSFVYENKSQGGTQKAKKFYTNRREARRRVVARPKEDQSKGYKNLYQIKKEGHARLRKATQKQFAKYFGTTKD